MDVLPNQFRFAHAFCVHLHDSLVRLVKYGEANRSFDVRFHFRKQEHADTFGQIIGDEIWEWFEKHGYGDVLGEMLLKTLVPALLTDFCHFLLEALTCSRKGKLTVTYALLRKPLREDLLFLEWLLADPEEMINTFYNESPEDLLRGRGDREPDRLRSIISRAIERFPAPPFYGADWQYELRFDRSAGHGYEPLWNNALHLITTRKPFHTERQNFNFIFSDDAAHLSQWNHLYGTLPFVLYHASEVCEVLLAIVLRGPMPDYEAMCLHRTLGFLLFASHLDRTWQPDHSPFEDLGLSCPRCGALFPRFEEAARALFSTRRYVCPSCQQPSTLEDIAADHDTPVGVDAKGQDSRHDGDETGRT